jgi:hypothetical protein
MVLTVKHNQQYRCIVSPGIVEIRSNVPFMLGGYSLDFQPNDALSGMMEPKIGITCEINSPILENDGKSSGQRRLYWSRGEPNKDTLLYERKFFKFLTARLTLSGLDKGNPRISANKTYNNLVRVRTNILFPFGTMVLDVLQTSLLMNDYYALHGAAFGASGGAALIIGLPGVGKSTVLFNALEKGFQFISEDMMIADIEGKIHACPGASSFAYDLRRTKAKASNTVVAKNRLMTLLARTPAAWFLKWPFMDILSSFPETQRLSHAKPIYIFILSNGSKHIEKISTDEAVRNIMSVNFHTFAYYENTLLHEYSMLNPGLDLTALLKMEEQLIRTIVNQAMCFSCVAPSPHDFFPLMEKVLVL